MNLPPIAEAATALETSQADAILAHLHADLAECGFVEAPARLDHRARRVQVFSSAFDAAISQFRQYSSILSEIKREYDAFFQARMQKQREIDMHAMQQATQESAQQTAANYRLLISQLQSAVRECQKQNTRVHSRMHWAHLRAATLEKARMRKLKEDEVRMAAREKRRLALVASLGPDRATNPAILQSLIDDYTARIAAVRSEDKYVPKKQRDFLEAKLSGLEADVNDMETRVADKKEEITRLRALIKERTGRKRGGKGEAGETAGDVRESTQFAADEEEELDRMTGIVVQFSNLFETAFAAGKYTQAAEIAITSPRRILRTPTIVDRFRTAPLSKLPTETRAPLMAYCMVLTTIAPGPSKEESLVCAECCVAEHSLDTLVNWIINNKLVLSRDMAAYLEGLCKCSPYPSHCKCRTSQVAATIYESLPDASADHIRLLVRQNLTQIALSVAKLQQSVDFSTFVDAFCHQPIPALGLALARSALAGDRSVERISQELNTLLDKPLQDVFKAVTDSAVLAADDDRTTDNYCGCLVTAALSWAYKDVDVMLQQESADRAALEDQAHAVEVPKEAGPVVIIDEVFEPIVSAPVVTATHHVRHKPVSKKKKKEKDVKLLKPIASTKPHDLDIRVRAISQPPRPKPASASLAPVNVNVLTLDFDARHPHRPSGYAIPVSAKQRALSARDYDQSSDLPRPGSSHTRAPEAQINITFAPSVAGLGGGQPLAKSEATLAAASTADRAALVKLRQGRGRSPLASTALPPVDVLPLSRRNSPTDLSARLSPLPPSQMPARPPSSTAL